MHFQNSEYSITSKKILSPFEQAHLRATCDRAMYMQPLQQRNALIFLLLLECGMRISELLHLSNGDFSPENETLFITGLKGSRSRELPLKHQRALQLKKYLQDKNKAFSWRDLEPRARMFDIGYHAVRQKWDYYRPHPDKGIHSLRHTFAVNLYEKSKDLKVCQIALGHKSINNTMVYLDFFYSQTVLRKIMHG